MEKKILFLSPLPPPFGGIASWTQILVDKGFPPSFSIKIINTGVPADRIAFESYKINLKEIKRNIKIVVNLFSVLRKEPIALAHLNCSLSLLGLFRDWLCTLIIRCYKVPLVLHLHGNFKPKNSLEKRFYNAMFSRSSAIIVLNKNSFKSVDMLGEFASKCCILPNFIEITSMPQKAIKSKVDSFNLIFVGWIAREKGILTILEVAKRLPKVKVTLVGETTREISKILDELLRNPINQVRIEITGRLSKPEVIKRLLNADVFILPSYTEGFPCSVAEAMACGLPILASPVGAIPDMIENGKGGYLIESQDVDGYVKALLRLMEDKPLRDSMGTYNKLKAYSEYDYAVVIKKLCELYDSVLCNYAKKE